MKTVTYGMMHLTVAVTVAFVLTRDIKAALAIGLFEPCIQTFAYAFHERIWEKFRLSKTKCSDQRGDLALQ